MRSAPRSIPICRAALALVVATLFASAGQAQSVVSASFGQSFLTGGDQAANVASLEYGYEISDVLELSADASFAFRYNRDDFDLFRGSPDWGVRRHARAGAALVVTPIRFGDEEVQHRVGLFAGPAVRYVNDERFRSNRTFQAGFPGSGPRDIDALVEDLQTRGLNTYVFEIDQNEDGVVEATRVVGTRPYEHTGFGAELGVRYELRFGQVLVGVDASMLRYANQDGMTGSDSWDLGTRVGYRF